MDRSIVIHRRRNLPRHGRGALLWVLVFFCVFQVLLDAVLERRRPELRDPDYGCKLSQLRQRLAENPGRPLALVLGSSRTLNGLRPEILPDSGTGPLVFNYGLAGSSPLYELLHLQRLLKEGIRPRWVLVEVLPPLLLWQDAADDARIPERQAWCDLLLLRRYSAQPSRLYARWAEARLTPWYAYRFCLLNEYAFAWLPTESRKNFFWTGLDRLGWNCPGKTTYSAEEHRRAVELTHEIWGKHLETAHVAPAADRALRELLALCRQQGIETAVFVMPEAAEFRGWYPPLTRAEIDAYFARLSAECAVPVVDARGWIEDADFSDGHHLLPDGAAKFTQRFHREALQPLFSGWHALAAAPLP